MFAREAKLKRVVTLLRNGTSVELLGNRWAGRTSLLNQVARDFERSKSAVLVVRALGKKFPLESLRLALPYHSQSPLANPAMVLDRIAALRPTAILIDDSNILDDASWTVIEFAHKSLGIPLLGVNVQHPVASVDEPSLAKFAHPIVRVTLDEFTLQQLHDLLEEELDGSVSPGLSARVHEKSAGAPGFALAIVRAAVANGQISRAGTTWSETGDLWSPDLIAPFEGLLYSYENDVQEAAEMLATAGAVDIASARQLLGQEMVELLEQHALARVIIVGHRTLVAVNPPGLADYFLHQPITARRIRMRETVTAKLDNSSSADDTIGQFARTLPEQDEVVMPSARELPAIVRMFSDSQTVEAERALEAWERTPSVSNANIVLWLLLGSNLKIDVLRRVAEETSLREAAPFDELVLRYLCSRQEIARGGTLDTARRFLTAAPGFPFQPALEVFSRALSYEFEGIPSDVEEQLAPFVLERGINGAVARLVLAYVRILTSRADEAFPLFEEAAEAPLFLRGQFDVAYGLALFGSGQHSKAAVWATRHMNLAISSIDRPALVGHSYVAVLSLAALGRFDEVTDVVAIVLGGSVSAGAHLFTSDRALLLILAGVATRTARNSAAEGLTERAESVRYPTRALPYSDLRLPRAARANADGDPALGARLYAEAAVSLSADGYQLAADTSNALSLIVHYDPELAQRHRTQLERVGGRLYRGYLDGRAAAFANDPEGLIEAARSLREEHAGDEALRFYLQAVTHYRETGDDHRVRAVRAEMQDLVTFAEARVSQSQSRTALEGVAGLTAREAEVINAVSEGRSNAEIAAELGVGARTVETHLRNIRRKIGAVTRDDIASFASERDAFEPRGIPRRSFR